MSELLPRILADIKEAMKARESARLEVLRTLHSDIKNISINSGRPIDDGIVTDVLMRSVKQHTDSLEQFRAAGRDDLVGPEELKLALFRSYLPQPLSEDDLKTIIAEVIAQVGASQPTDMGKVMKELQPRIKGRADGKMVSGLVSSALKG